MSTSGATANGASLGALRRFVDAPAARPGQRCELCRAPLAEQHAHVVNLESRALRCTCRACYLLFTPGTLSDVLAPSDQRERPIENTPAAGPVAGQYRAVPERVRSLPAFHLSPEQWDRLQIPVGIAFFFFNSAIGRVSAFYPSPAGATESLLPLDAWQDLTEENPVVGTLEPDVEALLVRSHRGQPFECFLVPIDACYELTGHVRRRWKGFDGGADAWQSIDAFFARLRGRSEVWTQSLDRADLKASSDTTRILSPGP